jgi:hypothetical protein
LETLVGPTVKLRLGDMFDGPSDLIVLPCSTYGTITGFVARPLVDHSIPHPREGMTLGEIEVLPFVGGERLAQYVAFAASVKYDSSRIDAIEKVGRALGDVTVKDPSIRAIAAPLLGAGAGGISSDKVVTALKAGFSATASSAATLVIHVLDTQDFNRLKGIRGRECVGARRPVRVFISHAAQSADAIEWVQQLALSLIEHGVQARLDRFHLRRGMDLPQWMCNELALAEKVLIVCDETYKAKADGRLGGVGWETMIIQGDLANLPSDSTKYQIVVRTEQLEKGLPAYLKTRYSFHVPPAADGQLFREDLLREIFSLPLDDRLEARELSI